MLAALLLTLDPSAPSRAESAADALERGAFQDAESLGEASEDAVGLTIAANAHLIEGRFFLSGEEKIMAFRQAEALANRAIAANARYEPAHIALAVALGCLSRHQNAVALYFRRTAERGRLEIEKALQIAPGDPVGLALLGKWHLEVVRRAGTRLAESLYRASLAEGIHAFETALAEAPDNAVIHAEFGLALLEMRAPELKYRAKLELDKAVAYEPRTLLERLTLADARDALAHLS